MSHDSSTEIARRSSVTVRPARESDAADLVALMRELAVVERYIDRFRVTPQDLIERGLAGNGLEQFTAFVAQHGADRIAGYAVVYEIPFTYDLRPQCTLKELFVREPFRGESIGAMLMATVIAHARQRGCARLKWEVLPDNLAAKRFYTRLGGAKDEHWENWILHLL